MIQIIVQAQKASCRKSSGERITTGMVGKQVSFDFSAEWDGLVKTAVFEGSGVKKDVTLSGDTAVIPHECLTVPGGMLRVGVYGTDGTIQTPTVYTDIGQIEQGADPSGDTSADPTLPIWAQLQAMMGSLDNLTTTAKENLVAAINEAAKSGGGGGTAADVKMQVAGGYIQYSSDGGANWNNLIAVAELIGPTDETLTKSGKAADAAVVGNRLSALSEEMLTEESDPTVPAWAKEAQKPSYTAYEVGADPSGTAASQVAAHNTGADTHSDIRMLIQGLTDRLNALADSDDTTLDQLSEIVAYIKSNRDLISAITTSKVNVADIVDNLTTNVANKPLSAAQGVALKALIDALTDAMPKPYTLPIASSTVLGGVQPVAKTDAMTQSVGVDEAGALWAPAASGGGSSGGGFVDVKLVYELITTEQVSEISISLTEEQKIALKSANQFCIYMDLKKADEVTTSDTNSGNVLIIPGYNYDKLTLESAVPSGNIDYINWAVSAILVDMTITNVTNDPVYSILQRTIVAQQHVAALYKHPNSRFTPEFIYSSNSMTITPAYPVGSNSIVRIYAVNSPA